MVLGVGRSPAGSRRSPGQRMPDTYNIHRLQQLLHRQQQLLHRLELLLHRHLQLSKTQRERDQMTEIKYFPASSKFMPLEFDQ